MILIDIPVSPAVKKFIEKDHQHFMVPAESKLAIKVTKRHYLGNLIAMNLCSNVSEEELYNLRIAEDHKLTFLVQGYYPKALLSSKKITMISRHLELEFKKGFVNWISIFCKVNAKGTVSEAIRQFYKEYKLEEDDYALLTLRTYYHHHLTGKRAI